MRVANSKRMESNTPSKLRFKGSYYTSYLWIAFVMLLLISACDKDATETQPSVGSIEGYLYDHIGLSPYQPVIRMRWIREIDSHLEELADALKTETIEDNRWSRLYEQALGIQIQYDWTARGDLYAQKLGVAISSGNLPDVVRVNAQQLRELSNADLIQDLTEIYPKYATPLTKEIYLQEGTGPFEAATIRGRLMAIPDVSASIEGAEFIWIRTEWLETLQLQPPSSIQDVLDISKAFTEKDPDRNGKRDTLGVALTQHLWDPVMGIGGFMAGFGAYPRLWIEDESGALVFGGVQPEVKDALEALQNMYQTGQIDPEFFFKDGMKMRQLVAEGKIGMLYGQQWGAFVAGISRVEDQASQWQAFPIVTYKGEKAKVPLKFSTGGFFAVRKGYEHPEALVKMINLHLEKNWGETAEFNTYYISPYPVWQWSPVTPYPALKNLTAFRQLERARLTGDASELEPEALAIQHHIDHYVLNADEAGWGWERIYGPEGAFSIVEHYIANDQLLYDQFVGAPTETMVEMKAILDDLMHDTYVNIILGRPLDEFDEFVEKWHRLGGTKMTAEVNAWYASARNVGSTQ